MEIIVDTREHKAEAERIQKQLDALGHKTFRSKLFVGDYQSLDNARLVVDRKKDLQELCGNVCQQHERFTNELRRAKENGIKLIILCEHGGIKDLSDVQWWINPRLPSCPASTVAIILPSTIPTKDIPLLCSRYFSIFSRLSAPDNALFVVICQRANISS